MKQRYKKEPYPITHSIDFFKKFSISTNQIFYNQNINTNTLGGKFSKKNIFYLNKWKIQEKRKLFYKKKI